MKLFVPPDQTGSEDRMMAVLDEIHAGHGIIEIVATGIDGADRFAVGWAMRTRIPYRLCVPWPVETGDLYQLSPFGEGEGGAA